MNHIYDLHPFYSEAFITSEVLRLFFLFVCFSNVLYDPSLIV